MKHGQKELADSALRILGILFVPLCLFYLELLFSMLLHYRITLYDAGFTLAAAALLLSLSFASGQPRVHFVLQGMILGILTVLYLSQFLYSRIFQTLYIVQSLKGAGKALSFASVLLDKMKVNAGWIFLFLVPLILFFTCQRILLKKITYSVKLPLLSLAAAAVACGGMISLVLHDTDGALSPRILFLHAFVQEKSLTDFGLITTMSLDIKYNVLHVQSEEKTEIDAGSIRIVENPAAAEAAEASAAGSPDISAQSAADTAVRGTEAGDTAPDPVPTAVPVPNIMDITFDFSEEDPALLEMNTYFSRREPTYTNAYTGLFKGKNLILITAEGFSKYVIDPELTPTLYKLATEGFVFNNFYTPVWGVSTSDGEYAATTGLIPKAGVWSYTEISDNYMPFAFGRQFAALGYVSRAYHDHTYTYYNRDRSYPTMGYIYEGLGSGLDVAETWPESDLEMMQKTVPEYVHDAPFHVYYMTVSGHLQYNFGGNFISAKNRDLVEDLPYSGHVKAYLACQAELDLALENLLEQLEAAGQLDNTVIALSADHYPYGLTVSEYDELAGHELESTFEMYKNAFILWSADMEEPVVIDKYCSSLDIAPTLSNLFGLAYDSRLYMGTDILSASDPTVFFQDRSFINGKIMYDANSGEVINLSGELITEDYVRDCLQSMSDAFTYSARIIDEDYYRYLFGEGSS